MFLGFRPVSGISAHFSLFFNCFTGFCSVFYDFLPLCSFQAKIRLSPAFIGFLRLFARFCLFCSVFPYIRAFNSVLTDFLRFRSVLRFYPLLPIFSVFFALFWRIYRVSPYLSRIQQVFELRCALLRKYRTFRSNNAFPPLFVYPSCFSAISRDCRPISAFYGFLSAIYAFVSVFR